MRTRRDAMLVPTFVCCPDGNLGLAEETYEDISPPLFLVRGRKEENYMFPLEGERKKLRQRLHLVKRDPLDSLTTSSPRRREEKAKNQEGSELTDH